jgi:hypothetical protein
MEKLRRRATEFGCGTIVCSIDDDDYTTEFSRDNWSYLKVGIMIRADNGALLHYVEADEDFEPV